MVGFLGVLLITRPTIFNPEKRYNAIGKVQEFAPETAAGARPAKPSRARRRGTGSRD